MATVDPSRVQGQTSLALNGIQVLLEALRALDPLLYEARYADEAPGFNADLPYEAIGEAYDQIHRLEGALERLRNEVSE